MKVNPDEPRFRFVWLYFEAVLVLGAYLVGGGPLRSWLFARCAAWRHGWLVADVLFLSVVVAFYLLLDRWIHPRATWKHSQISVSRCVGLVALSLLLLGFLAVGVRLTDPSFDRWAFEVQGFDERGVILQWLWTLPIWVAVEQFVFRMCQKRLRRSLGPLPAVLAAAAAFGLIHIPVGQPLHGHGPTIMLSAFVGGLVFAATFELTGRIGSVLVIHVTYDLLAFAHGFLALDLARLREVLLMTIWIGLMAIVTYLQFDRIRLVVAESEVLVSRHATTTNRWIILGLGSIGFGLVWPWVLR